MKPKVVILRAAGTNCEVETSYAFEIAGGEPQIVHVNALRAKPGLLRQAQALAIPGGFSYGDDVASGRILANELMCALRDELLAFVEGGGHVIGICNGFQVLVKSGLLPRLDAAVAQVCTLSLNANGRYTDRWVTLEATAGRCAWIPEDGPLDLPVAHAEGRFRASGEILNALAVAKQIALRYRPDHNFNGSDDRIAGVCDSTGRVFGLMPHPERFLRWQNHPRWTRLPRRREGDGIRIFRTALRRIKEG